MVGAAALGFRGTYASRHLFWDLEDPQPARVGCCGGTRFACPRSARGLNCGDRFIEWFFRSALAAPAFRPECALMRQIAVYTTNIATPAANIAISHERPRQQRGPEKSGSELRARNGVCCNAGRVIVGGPGDNAGPE